MLDPFTTSAIISGGVNAFGSLLGLGASNKAAQASLQATRETNATNERLVKEMNAFNALQQDKQNEYNSLKQQKKRALSTSIHHFHSIVVILEAHVLNIRVPCCVSENKNIGLL